MLSMLRDLFRGAKEAMREDAIASDAAMVAFISTRAAHVAQTALFGYLRTRMGTRQREIFQDEQFAEPLRIARQTMLMHCLSDLCVFAAALVDGDHTTLARQWYREAALVADADLPAEVLNQGLTAFEVRLASVDWAVAAEREGAFVESPKGLLECAPIIDDLKELDAEIVRNSVRFRWTDVRRQLRERVQGQAFAEGAGR